MKSLLVPVAGSDSDLSVFRLALSAATALAAHLDFVHVHLRAGEAATHMPHVPFARGAALSAALDDLQQRSDYRALIAEREVYRFCKENRIDLTDQPTKTQAVSAYYRDEQGDALERLVQEARCHDMSVVARPSAHDGLPTNRLEILLMQSGRPLLIASHDAGPPLLETVLVLWKDTPHAARAVAAATPLLCRAHRVVIGHIQEQTNTSARDARPIVRQLKWYGIEAASRVFSWPSLSTADALGAAAKECAASLVVMGSYSRGPARELLFGGCTQAVLDAANVPVFLVH
jgi:nucleotide-binding universal stress UspA family protein